MQHDFTPDPHRIQRAQSRALRRAQLWTAAKVKLGKEQFLQCLAEIELAVAQTLKAEFPDLAK